MNTSREGKKIYLGRAVLSGTVASLIMLLVILYARYSLGVGATFELIADRIAPLIPVMLFGKIIGIVGGYTPLKELGVISVLVAQTIVGIVGGIIFGRLFSLRDERPRAAITFLVIFVAGLWLLSMFLLWPVLGSQYRGAPAKTGVWETAFTLLCAYAAYGLTILLGYGALSSGRAEPEGSGAVMTARGAFLLPIVGVLAACGAGVLLRKLFGVSTIGYDGTQYKGADVRSITPNDRFYVVTKNVLDPAVSRDAWQLDIDGLVGRPRTYRFADLTALPSIRQETTLMCISNEVGAGLMSNAVWKAVPLRTLLGAAAPKSGIAKVVFHAADSYSDTIDFEKAMNPTTLVAYEMNGAELPAHHGYPVRMIVPGLFGEKSVKWLRRIELTERDAKGFYQQQGWGPSFVTPTHSRIDAPSAGSPLAAGKAAELRGIAFAGDRGVSGVEVSTSGGTTWRRAQIVYPGTRLTWVLWRYDWRPEKPGRYDLAVRATDGMGNVQTASVRGTEPQGSTGYHHLDIRVV